MTLREPPPDTNRSTKRAKLVILEADLKARIQVFEQQLDAALAQRPIMFWDANATLGLVAELCEVAAARQDAPLGPEALYRGVAILAPRLVSGQTGHVPEADNPDDIKQALADLIFAGHYYMLRELLYYSYNAVGAVDWSFGEATIDLRYADRSIPRQFFTIFNDMVLGSAELFKSFDEDREKIRQLLANEPEGVATPNLLAAGEIIGREVKLKLSAYFSLIAPDSDIDLGGYRYRDFLKLYSGLTAKALYHRYMARDRDAVGAIYLPEADLVAEAAADLKTSNAVIRAILSDIVFDQTATADRLDGSYFSLMREDGPHGRIIMRPHHFATDEGLVNLLRVVAQRRPQTFLHSVSNTLGAAFVQHVRRSWEAQGFTCHAEVSLRDIDTTLPDIDLIVVSEEPTLGYVIFVCELKAPVPPKWAKDQLRVLNKDSVSKAFRQTDALRSFLATQAGAEFLARIVPRQHPYFEDFVVTVQHLIITSDNGGMFFGDENTEIINYRTLDRLLRRSDGDMALIQHVLATYNEEADGAVVTVTNEVAIGATTVRYEAVTTSPLLEFPQGEWRSSPTLQAEIDAFIVEGLKPWDSFEHRSPDAVIIRRERADKDRA